MLPQPIKIFVLSLLSACSGAFAQNLKFRLVSSDSLAAVNVKVINIVNEKTAVSNSQGEFSMEAKPGHMLVFPSENYEYKRYSIQEEDVSRKIVTIVLIPKPLELDEVVILRDINPEDLGLVPRGQKKYTPAERKLYAASTGPVDIIVNAISGRTKMLKKQVALEKKEALLHKLEGQFYDSVYVEKLHIPADYVKGFQYFCVDDKEVVKALESKHKPALYERISQLAPTYIELIAKEQSESKP